MLMLACTAQAQSPWVGRWYYVAEESRRSPITFTLMSLSSGRLRFNDGSKEFVLAAHGRPAAELLQPAISVQTEALTPTSFRYVEAIEGKPVERVEQRLSSDGTRLLGHRTFIARDGQEIGRDMVSLRVGSGSGFAGTWRELPPVHDKIRERSSAGSPQPYWIISQDSSGTMTWHVVPTGEVLKGAADGKRYPVGGPGQPKGRSFAIKSLGARHLQFFIYDDGHLVTQTDETISADGERWTDLIWTPSHPDEKDRLVYHRG